MKLRSILILSMILSFSCGSSKTANKEKIKLNSYATIVCSSGIEIYYSQGKSHTAEVDKSDNVEVSVKDGSLILHRKGRHNGKATVYLSSDRLDAVILSGGSKFSSKEIKNGNKFSVAASGGSNIEIETIGSDNCNVALSGGSSCTVKRVKSDKVNVATSGGSNTNITIDKSRNANVAASGGSDITIGGKVDNISISASGNAGVDITSLKYDNININQSGKGRIRK